MSPSGSRVPSNTSPACAPPRRSSRSIGTRKRRSSKWRTTASSATCSRSCRRSRKPCARRRRATDPGAHRMTAQNVLFLVVLAVAAGIFSLNVQRLVRYLRLGLPEDRTDHPWWRLSNVLKIGIAQTKILREPIAGVMHATIFWGFIVLTAGTIEIFIQGVFAGFSYERVLWHPLYVLYALSQDGFAVFVLGAVAFAFYRRLVLHPRRLEGDHIEHLDAYIILGLIAGLMVTLLFANAVLSILQPDAVGPEKFVSRALATPFRDLAPRTTLYTQLSFWWSHVLLVLIFLNYLPYSKHLHVVTSLINVYFSYTSWRGERAVMRPMVREAETGSGG